MSVCNPLAYSLIRDLFPPNRITTANSIFSSAIYVGNAIASLNIIMIESIGWRDGYKYIGLYGIVFSIITVILLKEPPRERFAIIKLQMDNNGEFVKS